MNANEALHWMEHDTGIMSCNDKAWPVVLRALRLLAEAEANDGTSPETNRLSDKISRRTFAQNIIKAEDVFDALDLSRTFEQRCNGLAARVRELDEDAARLDWCQANHFAPRATLVTTGGDTSPKVWINDQPRLGYMGRSLREAIDAARSK